MFTKAIVYRLTLLLAVVYPCVFAAPLRPPDDLLRNFYYDSSLNSISEFPGNITQVLARNVNLRGPVRVFLDSTGLQRVGWNSFYQEIDPSFLAWNANKAYYVAGYVEGKLNQPQIWDHVNNLFPKSTTNATSSPSRQKVDATVAKFVSDQRNWVNQTSLAESATSSFWREVQKSVQQMQGIIDGYQQAAPMGTAQYLPDTDIYNSAFHWELREIIPAVGYQMSNSQEGPNHSRKFAQQSMQELIEKNEYLREYYASLSPTSALQFLQSHCSALIKVTADNLYVAHDTWTSYSTMHRQYKVYAFETTVAFSGYPGIPHSGDDWYMTSSGFAVQETTISNTNPANLWYVTNQTVPEFIRVMVANRIATSSYDWVYQFCQHNSGTYNNQYMVVDMKLFNPNGATNETKIPDGMFWIVEQLPGYCLSNSQDASSVLRNQGYWASYNEPALLSTQMESGNLLEQELYGSFFSHSATPRAQIFRRNQSSIQTLHNVQALMRYNNYMNDPLSKIPNCSTCPGSTCVPAYSSCLAIACRGDLGTANLTNLTGGPLFQYFGRHAFGATDSKIAQWKNFSRMEGSLISGPTQQPWLPTFSWTEPEWSSYPHQGLPDKYDFSWVSSADLLSGAPRPADDEPTEEDRMWLIGLGLLYGFVFLAILIAVLIKRKFCAAPPTTGHSRGQGQGKENLLSRAV